MIKTAYCKYYEKTLNKIHKYENYPHTEKLLDIIRNNLNLHLKKCSQCSIQNNKEIGYE